MTWRQQRNVIRDYVAFLVFGSLASSPLAGLPARAADWPQHRGQPSGAAVAPAPAGRILVPAWTRRLPNVTVGSVTYPGSITGNAAIVDGVVYVGSRNTVLYALDAATGVIKWEYNAGGEIESTPLVKDGSVYLVSFGGHLTALNAADGTVRWVHPTGGLQDRSSPNASGGNIIGAVGFPKTSIYAVPIDSDNPAFEAWHFDTTQFVYSSPAVDPATQNVFAMSDDGRLYGIKPDGSALWPRPFEMIGGVFRASPALGNGKVYASSGDYDWALHAVNAATGEQVWETPMVPAPSYPSTVYRAIQVSSPAVDGDFIAIVGGYGNTLGPSTLYAFRDKGATAELIWTASIPNSTSESYVSSPVLTPTEVLVGVAARTSGGSPAMPRGRMMVVDRTTGAQTWYAAGNQAETGGPIYASPAIANGLIVIGDTSGLVTAYKMVLPGDVDADDRVTALDALMMLGPASADGIAEPAVRFRGDLLPAASIPPDAARSFGNALVTPADADLVLQKAIGLK